PLRCRVDGQHQCSEGCDPELLPKLSALTSRTLRQAVWDIREVEYSLEQMARSLVESGEYRDKIIELGICLFEYERQSGRIYKVLGSWEWFEAPGFSIPSEITNITGITDEMVAGHCIANRAVDDLLRRVVL